MSNAITSSASSWTKTRSSYASTPFAKPIASWRKFATGDRIPDANSNTDLAASIDQRGRQTSPKPPEREPQPVSHKLDASHPKWPMSLAAPERAVYAALWNCHPWPSKATTPGAKQWNLFSSRHMLANVEGSGPSVIGPECRHRRKIIAGKLTRRDGPTIT